MKKTCRSCNYYREDILTPPRRLKMGHCLSEESPMILTYGCDKACKYWRPKKGKVKR